MTSEEKHVPAARARPVASRRAFQAGAGVPHGAATIVPAGYCLMRDRDRLIISLAGCVGSMRRAAVGTRHREQRRVEQPDLHQQRRLIPQMCS